ncbi:unnamed protein product [Moneuplotes crassus]|uniref:Uncharacterized protein n=1 Tax=Euplotes crassus TaxID=5936 RepID=A0AAD1Y0V3_EUPCR|nr:unnamed protein product [Moneuplotes crassus]
MDYKENYKNSSKKERSYYPNSRTAYGTSVNEKQRSDSKADRFLKDAITRKTRKCRRLSDYSNLSKQKYKTNYNSSHASQTSESAYCGNDSRRHLWDSSFISEGDSSLEQLQKQQKELEKMQNIIKLKMSSLNTEIKARASREHRRLGIKPRNALNNTMMCREIPQEIPPAPEKLQDLTMPISEYVTQTMPQSMTNSMIQTSHTKFTEEESVPLESSKRPSSSVSKSRRSRMDRYNDKSQERLHYGSLYNKGMLSSFHSTLNGNSNLKSLAKPVRSKFLANSRSNVCSKVRPENPILEEGTLQITKSLQVEKAAGLISEKTLKALKRIRPIQSSIQVIREFVKILKFYNPKLKSLNEEDTWMRLCFSIIHNSNIVLREIKLLSMKCTTYSQIPKVLEIFSKKILGKKSKNVPSCSTNFQKECQPFIRLVQTLINYYKTHRCVVESRSNQSLARSARSSVTRNLPCSAYKTAKDKKRDKITITLDSEDQQQTIQRRRARNLKNSMSKTPMPTSANKADASASYVHGRHDGMHKSFREGTCIGKENSTSPQKFNITPKMPQKMEMSKSWVTMKPFKLDTPKNNTRVVLSPNKSQRMPSSVQKNLSSRLSRPLLNPLNLDILNISENENEDEEATDENCNTQKVPENTIQKIARRHLASKQDGRSRDICTKPDFNQEELSFGTSNPTDENIFLSDRGEVDPTPRKDVLTQEALPEKPSQKHMDYCEGNMFEQNHTEISDEEHPRELTESFINLDTQTGQAEIYQDQASFEETPQVCADKDFALLRSPTDKRMINLSNNNEPVNISEMLSRSFMCDTPKELNLTLSAVKTGGEKAIDCKEIDFNPNNRLNITTNFDKYTPIKPAKKLAQKAFQERQRRVLEAMEKEYLKIEALKARRTSASAIQ